MAVWMLICGYGCRVFLRAVGGNFLWRVAEWAALHGSGGVVLKGKAVERLTECTPRTH